MSIRKMGMEYATFFGDNMLIKMYATEPDNLSKCFPQTSSIKVLLTSYVPIPNSAN